MNIHPIIKNSLRTFHPTIFLSLALLFVTAFGFEEINRLGNSNGYALYGYDTVAYFTEKKAVRGDKAFAYEWKNITWLFANPRHLDLFTENPEKYTPAYGGYCAWGLAAKNGLYRTDPEAWSIVSGKLYLNYSKGVRHVWSKNMEKWIKRGDQVWKNLLEKQKAS